MEFMALEKILENRKTRAFIFIIYFFIITAGEFKMLISDCSNNYFWLLSYYNAPVCVFINISLFLVLTSRRTFTTFFIFFYFLFLFSISVLKFQGPVFENAVFYGVLYFELSDLFTHERT